ncbi:membrane protein [Oceaniferula spumae]|uniref:Membrane protein n=1 Tax=Oceaniferula spumae TaxID=2979115 RepID=A0AAT9FST6_9BACT
MLYYWDIIGTFFFCVSGALAGRQKGMDFWGVFVLALVTGTGGGTLRSVMMGTVPPPIFIDPAYVILAAIATPCATLFPVFWEKFNREVSVMDAFGLGIFVCIGTDVAVQHGLSWWAAAGMGVITATFGGVIRDVLRTEVPLIFRKEIYATAALAGALLMLGLEHWGVGKAVSIPITVIFTAGVRLLAIRYAINQSSG